MDEDERLKPVLLNVEKQYTGKDYGDTTNVTGKVRASELDAVSWNHSPPNLFFQPSTLTNCPFPIAITALSTMYA